MQNVGVGVKDIYRNYGRMIEDFVCSDDGRLLHRQPRPRAS